MRYMIFVKANKDTEAGKFPLEPELTRLFSAMAAYHEDLTKAGVLLDASGLQPSSKGFKVKYSGNKRAIVDGPFAEAKELVAGYWVWEVKSMDEALEWVMQCPDPMPGEESELEIRPFYEPEDFGENLTPEHRAKVDELRANASHSHN